MYCTFVLVMRCYNWHIVDSTGPIAFKFGAILAALGGLYNIIASFIVNATGNVLPLIWIGRGVAAEDPEPGLYLTTGLILIVLCPILWFIGYKLDDD